MYESFTKQYNYSVTKEYCLHKYGEDKGLLTTLWNKTLSNEIITFDSLRKLSQMNHWFKKYIDTTYDMIMIDETQDFDIMMLKMLIDDTTIPKIFVGDPKQSIYQFRGCINAFKYLPKNTLTIEFYSTFRIGNPACDLIREQISDCWMIAKNDKTTQLSSDISLLENKNYTYLFRTWAALLTSAKSLKEIWIYSYDKKVEEIRKLHDKLHTLGNKFNDDTFEDDLPKFLKKLSIEDLENLISSIDTNIVAKNDAKIKLYSIHSYKGLEDDNIRIADDNIDDDENLHYVAITRGMKNIILDEEIL